MRPTINGDGRSCSWNRIGDSTLGIASRLKMLLRREIPDRILRRIATNRWVRQFVTKRRIDYTQITAIDLFNILRKLGVEQGDTLLVHSSFDRFRGIDGGVMGIINILSDAVGEAGTIIMPTFPGGSMKTAVETRKFDVRRSPSAMGLISEVFRRMNGVQRSLYPYHSFAAKGPLATWLVRDHEKSLTPFGQGTPLRRLLEVNGKVLLMGVDMQWTLTMIHVVEDIMGDSFPVSVYLDEPIETNVVDAEGVQRRMSTKVHNDEVYKHMNISRVEKYLWRDGIVAKQDLKGIEMYLLEARRVVSTLISLAKEGITAYSDSGKICKKL